MRLTALILLMFGAGCSATTRTAHVDHIMLGIRNLDEGIAELQQRTGVTAVRGGSHPGRGTENALVSLGDTTYVEIIAPQHDAPADESLAQLRKLETLTPVGWAAGVNDAEAARAAIARAGINVTPTAPGSRKTPSGATLGWVTFDLVGYDSDGVPFFIRWNPGTIHPSQSSPGGCALQRLSIEDPNAAAIQKALHAVGLAIPITNSERTTIALTVSCGGRVTTFANQNPPH